MYLCNKNNEIQINCFLYSKIHILQINYVLVIVDVEFQINT